jgi:hypothetical protein
MTRLYLADPPAQIPRWGIRSPEVESEILILQLSHELIAQLDMQPHQSVLIIKRWVHTLLRPASPLSDAAERAPAGQMAAPRAKSRLRNPSIWLSASKLRPPTVPLARRYAGRTTPGRPTAERARLEYRCRSLRLPPIFRSGSRLVESCAQYASIGRPWHGRQGQKSRCKTPAFGRTCFIWSGAILTHHRSRAWRTNPPLNLCPAGRMSVNWRSRSWSSSARPGMWVIGRGTMGSL